MESPHLEVIKRHRELALDDVVRSYSGSAGLDHIKGLFQP